jgi:hypothetical protein
MSHQKTVSLLEQADVDKVCRAGIEIVDLCLYDRRL